MQLRIFVEPQQGASYDQQLAVALLAEQLGFDAFFRSDHYLKMSDIDGLPGPTDSWVTLAGLARDTSTIRLGTLVTSATFRHPGVLAISVAQVDQMSGGRVELGIGAGWFEAEHQAYGIPFPDVKVRFDRLEEQLQVITGLWGTPVGELFSFEGNEYRVSNSPALPNIEAVPDVNRGKLSAHLDLRDRAGQDAMAGLLRSADVFLQGYRPGSLEAFGLGHRELAERHPGIVCASLSAWGPEGPWRLRRGFDSLVQTAAGFNLDEAEAAGSSTPKPMPTQILDHAAGYLLAFGIAAALSRRATEGGSWHVQVSLAQTAPGCAPSAASRTASTSPTRAATTCATCSRPRPPASAPSPPSAMPPACPTPRPAGAAPPSPSAPTHPAGPTTDRIPAFRFRNSACRVSA